MKPLVLTLTSVIVQTPTPNRTIAMLSFVSLEYRILSKTTSKRQETGIMLNFAIYIYDREEVTFKSTAIEHQNKA